MAAKRLDGQTCTLSIEGVPVLVIPVIDIKNGLAVHAIKGHRSDYRPVESRFAESADPVRLASGYRRQLGTTHLYVADLDAIAGASVDSKRLQALGDACETLWIDVGIQSVDDFIALQELKQRFDQDWRLILPLEKVKDGESLREIIRINAARPGDSIVFSLDMRDGIAMGSPFWQRFENPIAIAQYVVELGIGDLLLLDLGSVGAGQGPSALPLINEIRQVTEGVAISVGGGVRNVGDLRALADAGCTAALIATALHRGEIGEAELRPFLGSTESTS